MIVRGIRPPNLRLQDYSVPSDTAEIFDVLESVLGMLLEKPVEAGEQLLDHVRTYRLVEHRCRADLHGTAAEEEIGKGLIEVRDSADSRKTAVGERLGELRHLGERERQYRRPAQSAAGYESIDVDFELQRRRIDERDRWKGVGGNDCVGAAGE